MQINRVLSQFRESLEIFLIFPTATFRKGSLSTRKFLKTVFYRSFIRNFEHAFPLRFLSLCSRAQISRAPHLKETSVSKKETKKKKKKKKRASKNRVQVYEFKQRGNKCSMFDLFFDRRERSIARLFIVNSVLRDEIHSSQ